MSYNIIRYYSDSRHPRIMQRGLTLDQAQKWCNDLETSSKTARRGRGGCRCQWFDGYIKN